MNYILFDDTQVRKQLLPFTFTRPVCEIRIGVLTIREKWEYELNQQVSIQTEDYLSVKFPLKVSSGEDNIWINGCVLPNAELVEATKSLIKGECLRGKDTLIAINTGKENLPIKHSLAYTDDMNVRTIHKSSLQCVQHNWDIFSLNSLALEQDVERITRNRKSAIVSNTNILLGENIFIEEGVKMECAILNSTTGPIYISKNAEIMEGSVIRGPFALGEESVVKAGAKIYGPTTIGPHCKVGGEISNSVIFGYSNKAHDGFLGNSVIGEWCNLGADTNTSNLKNNYSVVSMYDYSTSKMTSTGLTFCGLMMGDHSKCGINTMFNTGTVVGVSANIFGGDFPPKYIPSFSWGPSNPRMGAKGGGFTDYELDKAIETATRVYERRHKKFDETERDILTNCYHSGESYKKIKV